VTNAPITFKAPPQQQEAPANAIKVPSPTKPQ
jgi:hypothetical protein